MALSQNNPYLNTLEASGCRNFTDLGFQALGRNCKYLERMDLEECNQITDLTLAHLATGCPSLEKLVKNSIYFCSTIYYYIIFEIIIFNLYKHSVVVFVTLRTDYGRWYSAIGRRNVCRREFIRP